MTRLRLTRGTRARLFKRETPPIKGDGRCPVAAGDIIELSSKVSLRVLHVNTRKGGGWSLHYELQDRRDPVRLLRRTPGISDESYDQIRRGLEENDGYPAPPTDDVLAKAALESAYTGAPSSLSDAGEAVDEVAQRRITQQAFDNRGQQDVLNQARRERHELAHRLDRVRADADLRGVDISSSMRVIERQLAKIERRIYQGRAA